MRILTNGVTLEVTTMGPASGPMVLLLHGFPECGHGWLHQARPLAEQGFFVVMPDQRGYAGSDKPPRVRDYRMDKIVGDALGLLEAFERDKVHLVGHDWGGVVAWSLATLHPERVQSLCILNMAHPRVMARRAWRPPQLLRSWYVLAFQVPRLPERALSAQDHALLVRNLQVGSSKHVFSEDELEGYRRCWRAPGAMRSMLAWYRAAVRHPWLPPDEPVKPPTLMLWGKQDPALGFEMVGPSAERCVDVRVEVFDDASHFVQHDEAERVNAQLSGFLQEHRAPSG
jgi:pimeloyl-ACP methyl ester carboxylesterase